MKIVVANHKANLTKHEFEAFQIALKGRIRSDLEVVICPSLLYLSSYDGRTYQLGSQNVSPFTTSSMTGEVSAFQLKNLEVKYCLVGHMERREYLSETDELVREKVKRLLEQDITPIVCIGENKEQRLLHKTESVLEKQIKEVCKILTKEEISELIFAYEPGWAIGTGLVPKKEEIERSIGMIREVILCNYQVEVKVLYGGSIDIKNIKLLEKIPNIDGYLIGGASLDVNKFLSILNEMN